MRAFTRCPGSATRPSKTRRPAASASRIPRMPSDPLAESCSSITPTPLSWTSSIKASPSLASYVYFHGMRVAGTLVNVSCRIRKTAAARSWSIGRGSSGASTRHLVPVRASNSSAAHSTAAASPKVSRIPCLNRRDLPHRLNRLVHQSGDRLHSPGRLLLGRPFEKQRAQFQLDSSQALTQFVVDLARYALSFVFADALQPRGQRAQLIERALQFLPRLNMLEDV